MKIFEKVKNKVKKATMMVSAGATSLMLTAVPALAAKDATPISTGVSQLDDGINKIIALCKGLVIGIGVVALVWGVYGLAMSFMQHDESQRISAIPKLVAGVLMIAVGVVMNWFGY